MSGVTVPCADAATLKWCRDNGITVEVAVGSSEFSRSGAATNYYAAVKDEELRYRLVLPSEPVECAEPSVLAWWVEHVAPIGGKVQGQDIDGLWFDSVCESAASFRDTTNDPLGVPYRLVSPSPTVDPEPAPTEQEQDAAEGITPERLRLVSSGLGGYIDSPAKAIEVREVLSAAADRIEADAATIVELRATVADRAWGIEVRDERIKLLDEEVEMSDHAATKLTAQVAALEEALTDARSERDDLRSASPAPSPVRPEGLPDVPLMRAEDVDRLWQEGGTGSVGVALWKNGELDWLMLNEVACSRTDDPFLPEWPNLLVVAAPWTGQAEMPAVPIPFAPAPSVPATERVPLADVVGCTLPTDEVPVQYVSRIVGKGWTYRMADVRDPAPLPVNDDGTVTVLASPSSDRGEEA